MPTTLNKPIHRATRAVLDGCFGPDRNKRLVITLTPGKYDEASGKNIPDMLSLRPERSRRAETVALPDVYTWAIKCRLNSAIMAKLREKKEKKKQRAKERAWQRELKRAV